MNANNKTRFAFLVVVLAAVSVMAGTVSAVDVYLVAKPFTKTMSDATPVPMWGYEAYTDGTFGTVLSPVSSPGPLITVPVGDSTLNIHLRNNLAVPTSIFIPNLYAHLAPVFFTDPQGRQRAQSFDKEVAPGGTDTYTWTNVRPGSYLYESGSHPAVQVQMGLYGAVKKDNAAGEAYPGQAYNLEQILFFSEIDFGLHQAVFTGSYGQPNSAYISTIYYRPKYYLVNGTEYTLGQSVLSGTGTERVLVRCYNAGLKPHTATLLGADFNLIADDAYPSPYPHLQYTAYLPPGKVVDAIVTRPGAGVLHFYDRALYPATAAPVPDLNLDGLVTLFDVAILTDYLGGNITQGDPPFIAAQASADLNQDGVIDSTDLILLIIRTTTP